MDYLFTSGDNSLSYNLWIIPTASYLNQGLVRYLISVGKNVRLCGRKKGKQVLKIDEEKKRDSLMEVYVID